jgi:hypothetical protein
MSALETSSPQLGKTTEPVLRISNDGELLNRGVVRCNVAGAVDLSGWAAELAQVSPESVFAEDGEYAQYRNIKESCPSFPFDPILTALTPCLEQHFVDRASEVELDDAFAIHYNESHWDTRVAKHTDPSDITVNLCLERSEDLEGSQVQFFGTVGLKETNEEAEFETDPRGGSDEANLDDGGNDAGAHGGINETPAPAQEEAQPTACGGDPQPLSEEEEQRRQNRKSDRRGVVGDDKVSTFLVVPHSGWATVHWGKHPHLVTSLSKGSRTNVVLTYTFVDKARTRLGKSDCFLDGALLER